MLSSAAFAGQMLPYVPGQILVRFDKPTTLSEAKTALNNKLFNVDKALVQPLDIYLIKLAPNFAVDAALKEVRGYPRVKWAQADHIVGERLIPNDPQFGSQWDMQQASDVDIDAPEAWNISTGGTDPGGDPIVVAVVDGGCQLNHTDLAANIWVNTNEIAGNGIDDDGNGYIDDVNGWNAYNNNGAIPSNTHGTHVTGTVGARGNNSLMVTGVNWNVKIMEVAASSGTTSIIAIGYGYVLAMKQLWWSSGGTLGANVVSTNSSFGVDAADCASGSYPVWNDLYNAMGQQGVLSAAATANQNWNIDVVGDVPTGCSSPYIIAVTNTTSTDQRNSSAAYGATTIDLGAPGTNILSTYPTNTTGTLTGTSMATPHVAGAVGLMHAAASLGFYNYYLQHPDSGALLLKQIMLDNVDPIAALQGITVSGGRLNLYNAVNAINTYVGANPNLPNLVYTSHVVNDAAGNNDGVLDASETADVVVTLTNLAADGTTIAGTLTTSDPYLTVVDGSGFWGTIPATMSGDNTGDPFTLTAAANSPLEHVATLTLTLSADSGYQVVRTFTLTIGQKVTYWADSVEGGENSWRHSNVSGGFGDQWNISTEMYNSPTHSWKCGDTGTGTYANLLDAALVTPAIAVTAYSSLNFMHWMDSEISTQYTDSAYDGGVIEISVNGGAFSPITPVGGYPKTFRYLRGSGNPATGPMPGRPCYAGTIPWTAREVDLSAYAGQTVQVRFRFGSDSSTGREGWYVDDIYVSGQAPAVCHAPVVSCWTGNSTNYAYGQPLTVCASVMDSDNDVASVIAHYTTELCNDAVSATFAVDRWCVTVPASCTQSYAPIQVSFVATDACGRMDSTTCTTDGPPLPDTVTDVVIHSTGDDILLHWSPPLAGANYYVIYRNPNSEFAAEPADSIGWTADTTFTDPAIAPSTTQNYYIIRAVRN
jgi:hypothetical protein